MPNGLRIGTVAAQTGLTVDAIRFYEKQLLLDRAPRSEGGFRLFGVKDVQRIQFIRRAQKLGFSLPEIRELLALQTEGEPACSHVRDLLRTKIIAVRDKIRELEHLKAQLTTSLQKCVRAEFATPR